MKFPPLVPRIQPNRLNQPAIAERRAFSRPGGNIPVSARQPVPLTPDSRTRTSFAFRAAGGKRRDLRTLLNFSLPTIAPRRNLLYRSLGMCDRKLEKGFRLLQAIESACSPSASRFGSPAAGTAPGRVEWALLHIPAIRVVATIPQMAATRRGKRNLD